MYKYLGVMIDDKLLWSKQLENIIRGGLDDTWGGGGWLWFFPPVQTLLFCS